MKARKFSSKKVTLPASIQKAGFRHALLIFQGIDQSGPSYQARIFFNNPRASETTPMTPERGYAGKFHVFGNGRCWGDEEHCDVPEVRREFDNRSPHPLTPRQ